jgi:L-amino acid N-acyltransferase YncA
MLNIRPYRDADAEACRTVFNQIVEQGDAFVYETPLSVEQMGAYIASYSSAFVAELDGRIVGAYVMRANQPGRGAHVANATYMVAADARGHGVGHALAEHSLQEARRLGFAAMQFNAVVATNRSAVALWERLGFAIVGTIPKAFRLTNGELADLQVMYRQL